ncbi:MAG: tRNA ((46)-N7)-methyltransferase TrmB [Bacteroidota bacterium]
MGKDKLKKWAENKEFEHVFEPPLLPIIREGQSFFMKGKWHADFFKNEHPIVLELGCGKGEYTVGLARRYPHLNFIGVDVKGHRFHKGAKEAHLEGLKNVAFLRTRIEFIEAFFGENEVSEIWLTFSDPQPLDHVGNRRITSSFYLNNKYRKFLKKDGILHIKHDNDGVYDKALAELPAANCTILTHHRDIYGEYMLTQPEDVQDILNIRTFYEQMWLEKGRKVKYVKAVVH